MQWFFSSIIVVFFFSCGSSSVVVPEDTNSKIVDSNLSEINTTLKTLSTSSDILEVCDIEQKIEDLEKLNQDIDIYSDNLENRDSILDIQKHYNEHYFQPWKISENPDSLETIKWTFRSYTPGKMYGENLKLIKDEWFDHMLEKSNFESYGTVKKRAMTLHYSSLRNFPTHKPAFKDPSIAGEGFPFDYIQNSGVHANEPLFVSHYSKDGSWVYVFSAYATGWLRAYEIAYLPQSHLDKYMQAKQVVLMSDSYPIYDLKGRFVFKSRIGMRLPLISVDKDSYIALAITSGRNQRAIYTKVRVSKSVANGGTLNLNSNNLSLIGSEVFDSKYGWGGLYEERDCSSTLRDMYSAFGIWLPRNSTQQSKIGKKIDLSMYTDSIKKLEAIKVQGKAFETLLYRKGHILLYLGTYEDKVLVMHNMWGVKTKKNDIYGRKIVGKTVISTLSIGQHLSNVDKENLMIEKIESMNIITQR